MKAKIAAEPTGTATATRYTFKSMTDEKEHFTRGTFAGWTEPAGLLRVPYAIFTRRSGDLLVLAYLLTKETAAALPKAPHHSGQEG